MVNDEQGPLKFVRKNGGPQRELAHLRLKWDDNLHNQVGRTICSNGRGLPCNPEGYIRHLGRKFSPISGGASRGLVITANPDITGLSGGFGWLIELNRGAPRSLIFEQIEIDPSSVLLVSIPYPKGTSFEVSARASQWCRPASEYVCEATFAQVGSVDEVRQGPGNLYHVDLDGVLTVRVTAVSKEYVGNPDWLIADWETPSRWYDSFTALRSFERDGIRLPNGSEGTLLIQARCPSDDDFSPKDGYCPESVKTDYDPDICPAGYEQVAYDKCCQVSNSGVCVYADGSAGKVQNELCPIADQCVSWLNPDGVSRRVHKVRRNGICRSKCASSLRLRFLTSLRGFECGTCP